MAILFSRSGKQITLKNVTPENTFEIDITIAELGYTEHLDYKYDNIIKFFNGERIITGDLILTIYNEELLKDSRLKVALMEYLI